MSVPHRVQAGVPTGGQFAATARPESDVELDLDFSVADDTTGATGSDVTNLTSGADSQRECRACGGSGFDSDWEGRTHGACGHCGGEGAEPGPAADWQPDAEGGVSAQHLGHSLEAGPEGDRFYYATWGPTSNVVATGTADSLTAAQLAAEAAVAGGLDQALADFASRGISREMGTAWIAAGFSASDADAWTADGFRPAEAKAWHAAGFTRSRAAEQWLDAGFSAETADRWYRQGFLESGAAARWRDARFDPATAAQFARADFSPAEARAWHGERFTPDNAKAWSRVCPSPQEAADWRDRGFGVAEHQSWTLYDFTSEQAGKWRNVAAPREARRWVDAGFGYATAHQWQAAGFDHLRAAELVEQGHATPAEYAERLGDS